MKRCRDTDADIDKMDDAERAREYHDVIRAGVPNGPEPVAGFTTAKGATYEVREDGTTARTWRNHRAPHTAAAANPHGGFPACDRQTSRAPWRYHGWRARPEGGVRGIVNGSNGQWRVAIPVGMLALAPVGMRTGLGSPSETQTLGSFCDWRLTKR